MPIAALDKDTIKLINTSQIITSVSTAVKELLENALDANAKNIELILSNAGTSQIQVKDDGVGISKEDANYMGLPSYTSKIENFSDLESLESYGFRGEALAALCAMADVTITTKTEEEEAATAYIMNQSGKIEKSFTCHRSVGTTVQVKDLFKRLPVRRQIITNTKKGLHETRLLEGLLKAYAISKYFVHFNCRVDGSTLFNKPATKSRKEAAAYIFGKKVSNGVKWLQIEDPEITAELMVPTKAALGVPDVFQSGGQYIFVNDRPIQHKQLDKLVTRLISEGLSHESTMRKKPVYILYMLLDPGNIDVNLEPNKISVLFKNQEHLLHLIETHLRTFYGLAGEEPQTKDVTNISNSYLEQSAIGEKDPVDERPCKKRKIEVQHDLIENINSCKSTEAPIINASETSESEANHPNVDIFIDQLHLSESDSEESMGAILPTSNKISSNTDKEAADRNKSPILELSEIGPETALCSRESLSQLPEVDLGEDFNLEDLNKESEKENISNIKETKAQPKVLTLESWSKGHIDGVKSNIDIEAYVESYVRASQQSESVDESTTSNNKPFSDNEATAGFRTFLRNLTPQVTKENPTLTIPQIVHKLINRWKNLPVEERGYYRDIARETHNSSCIVKKEPKKEKSPVDRMKNKNRLLKLLGNMKNSNESLKENMVMRSTVPWVINIESIKHKFSKNDKRDLLIGKLSTNFWIVNHSGHIWLFDVVRFQQDLNPSNANIIQENSEWLEKQLKTRLSESDDLSSLHPICPVDQE